MEEIEQLHEKIGIDITVNCHLYDKEGTASKSWCGIPRQEQKKHFGWNLRTTIPNFCPICGLRPCMACVKNFINERLQFEKD